MTLQAPLFLLVLLAAPVAVVLYWRRERRIAAGQAAFASPALMPSVLPVRPGRRRHLPLIAYLLALVVLAIALARPQVAESVTVDQARIVLATDQSGSMAATDVLPTRLDAARRAAGDFLDRVPERVQVGAIAFNQTARVIASPSRDRVAVRSALAKVRPAGSTATGEALALAIKAAQQAALPGRKPPPSAIILLTDGVSVRGNVQPVDAAREAARAKIPIYTISLGTAQGTIPKKGGGTVAVPPDPETLKRIAQISGGEAYAVADAARLSTVYEKLGQQLTRKQVRRQVTAGFAGGALALLVLGAGLSLFLFGRLP